MGYPRRFRTSSPLLDLPPTNSRFVRAGLVYVCSSLCFIVLAVMIAVNLGPNQFDHKLISFGVVGIAGIHFVGGGFLLATFFLGRLASRVFRDASGSTSLSGGVWDKQLDG